MSKSRSGAQHFLKIAVAALAMSVAARVDAENMAHKAMVGGIMVEDAFARETLPNQPVAGAFTTVTNTTDATDMLIGGSSDSGRADRNPRNGDARRRDENARFAGWIRTVGR